GKGGGVGGGGGGEGGGREGGLGRRGLQPGAEPLDARRAECAGPEPIPRPVRSAGLRGLCRPTPAPLRAGPSLQVLGGEQGAAVPLRPAHGAGVRGAPALMRQACRQRSTSVPSAGSSCRLGQFAIRARETPLRAPALPAQSNSGGASERGRRSPPRIY